MAGTTNKKAAAKKPAGTGTRQRQTKSAVKSPRRREVMAAVCFLLAVFTFIGYWNSDGAFIGFFCGLAKGLIGYGYYALPPMLLICALILCFHRGRPVRYRVVCSLLLTMVAGALAHLFSAVNDYDISFRMFAELWKDGINLSAGGVVGGALSVVFKWLFAKAGAAIVFICAALFLLLSAFNRTVVGIVDAIKTRERRAYIPDPKPERPEKSARSVNTQSRVEAAAQIKRKKAIDIPLDSDAPPPSPEYFPEPTKGHFFKSAPRVKTPDELISEYAPDGPTPDNLIAEQGESEQGASRQDENNNDVPEQAEAGPDKPEEIEDLPLDIPFMESGRGGTVAASAASKSEDIEDPPAQKTIESDNNNLHEPALPIEPLPINTKASYEFPPVDLLVSGALSADARDGDEVRVNSERLEAAFRSFGVNVRISNTTRGPAVTRYEAELEAGVKLSRLTSLADDIALSLGTSGVRIAAMPNKISTVGIEVPNKVISKVNLRNIIESQEFKRAESKLTFAVGMDISGEAIVGNVSKLPHLLVAGTTGSGKSVCLNSLILSILYKASPEDVRFIMIDPKMVEFKVYNSIPHLLVPVVTDVKKAAGALQWAVVEMIKRYSLFSDVNAQDIDGYNEIARESEDREELPQIIVVIDELADLMMMAAKEVEESVCRVAQMGRAAGMHLVIATQSPRADVITGLMKANIPSRIAFRVSSALESRIILDPGSNADKLVGNGDMLYVPTGAEKPLRVQGSWVSDRERENVVEFIKKSGESQYSEEVMGEIEKASVEKVPGDKPKDDAEGNDYDELLPQAVDVIFETGQASVSMLQRRLKLGYSRAARIVDQMEKIGVVGPFEGSKPRALLVTRDQWRQMQYISGIAPHDSFIPDYVIPVTESYDDGFDGDEYDADDDDE